MSKLKVGLVAALLGFAGMVLTNKKAVADNTSGSISLTDGTMNKQTIFVYNQDAVSHSTGSVMCYIVGPSATYPGLSVSTSATAGDGKVAGIVCDRTIQASSWGFIQTRGYTPALKVTGTVAQGDTLMQSATAEKAGAYTVLLATGNGTQTSNIQSGFARCLDNASSSATVRAVLFGL